MLECTNPNAKKPRKGVVMAMCHASAKTFSFPDDALCDIWLPFAMLLANDQALSPFLMLQEMVAIYILD